MKKNFKVKELETFEDFRIPKTKRIFDILFSSIALLIVSPVLLITALLIKIESKGPIIFKSDRVGTGYDIFCFYKFRSMYIGSENKRAELSKLNQYLINEHNKSEEKLDTDICPECERLGYPCSPILFIDGNQICENFYLYKKRLHSTKTTFFKIKNDPRVTKIGKIIRITNIDELPQLINVLKGDMSIVGNRPLPLYEAEMLTSDQWALRFLAPAGITGLWQVNLGGKNIISGEARKTLDNKYTLDKSFWKDILIIIKTIPVMFRRGNI
ncbi:MAG: sugar transferase [Bacteroidales bacterium]|nr:sugar transferase [Bacteroidales bacterium]